ncbi:hypothetical protein ACQVP2_28815 [Methylobacterium aquaticum]|uniref:hypothetical protein n=1 Tax=Methylobacterium aquaticum TaxID=270351 RepID=UPI003D17CE44
MRLWVDRKAKSRIEIDAMQKTAAADQAENGLPVTADKNWIVVKPEDIHSYQRSATTTFASVLACSSSPRP